jgi:hypothetical protein
MNSYPRHSFNRPCPAINARPGSYARWSCFHAESSLKNISRKSRSLTFAPHSCRAADLVYTRYLAPGETSEAERAQEATEVGNDQAFPYGIKIILPAMR